jgi:hypothetical protein
VRRFTTLARMWPLRLTYSPSGVELMTFVGTTGLFLHFFPGCSCASCPASTLRKWTLLESDPH